MGSRSNWGRSDATLPKTEQIRSDNRNSKRHDHTSDDGDENPRPAKRRKLPVNTDEMLTPPREHSPPQRFRTPHEFIPPSSTQVEVDVVASQADHRCLPSPVVTMTTITREAL